MSTHDSRSPDATLKTATAAADPVLVRMATPSGNLVFLAEDLTYDRAGAMHFHQVRWVRARKGIRALFSLRREPAAGRRGRLTLRRVQGKWMGALPSEGWIQAPANQRGFAMSNLTADQHKVYRAGSPRRLLVAGMELSPKPASQFAQALRVVHRLRMASRSLVKVI